MDGPEQHLLTSMRITLSQVSLVWILEPKAAREESIKRADTAGWALAALFLIAIRTACTACTHGRLNERRGMLLAA